MCSGVWTHLHTTLTRGGGTRAAVAACCLQWQFYSHVLPVHTLTCAAMRIVPCNLQWYPLGRSSHAGRVRASVAACTAMDLLLVFARRDQCHQDGVVPEALKRDANTVWTPAFSYKLN